jgi:hypothetical protein
VMSTCIKPIRFLTLFSIRFDNETKCLVLFFPRCDRKQNKTHYIQYQQENNDTKTKRNKFSSQSKNRIVFDTKKKRNVDILNQKTDIWP